MRRRVFLNQIRALMMSLVAVGFLASCTSLVRSKVTVFYENDYPFRGMTYAFVTSEEQSVDLEHESYLNIIRRYLQKNGMGETTIEDADLAIFVSYEIDDGKQIVSTYPIYGQTGVVSSPAYRDVYKSKRNPPPPFGDDSVSQKPPDSGSQPGPQKPPDSGSQPGPQKPPDSGSQPGPQKPPDSGSQPGPQKPPDSGSQPGPQKPPGPDHPQQPPRDKPNPPPQKITPVYGVVGSGISVKTVYTRKLLVDMLIRGSLDQEIEEKIYQGEVESEGPSDILNEVMPSMIAALFKQFPGNNGKTVTVYSETQE